MFSFSCKTVLESVLDWENPDSQVWSKSLLYAAGQARTCSDSHILSFLDFCSFWDNYNILLSECFRHYMKKIQKILFYKCFRLSGFFFDNLVDAHVLPLVSIMNSWKSRSLPRFYHFLGKHISPLILNRVTPLRGMAPISRYQNRDRSKKNIGWGLAVI